MMRDSLDVIRRRRWLILAMVLLGALAARIAGGSIDPLARSIRAEGSLALAPDEDPEQAELYSYIADGTDQIRVGVEEAMGHPLDGEVTVDSVSSIGALRIVASGQPDEDTAREVVERYGAGVRAYGVERRISQRDGRLAELDTRAAELRDQIAVLDAELDQLEADAGDVNRRRPVDQLKEVELAAASEELTEVMREQTALRNQSDDDLNPFLPLGFVSVVDESGRLDPLGPNGRLAVGVVLGLIVGLALAYGLHRFDTRLFSRRDAEVAYAMPVLAEIPRVPWRHRRGERIIAADRPTDTASEAYRILRTGVDQVRRRRDHNTGGPIVVVTSASAAVGKTSTVANLAATEAIAGNSVLVVSADLRMPTIHHYLDVDGGVAGLTDAARALRSGEWVDLADHVVHTRLDDVDLLPHGTPAPGPGEILADVGPLLIDTKRRYDIVIVDTPPMAAGNDVDELLPAADLVLHVARAGRTTLEEGEWTEELIRRIGAPTCGLTLIGSRSRIERRSTARRSGVQARARRRIEEFLAPSGPLAQLLSRRAGTPLPSLDRLDGDPLDGVETGADESDDDQPGDDVAEAGYSDDDAAGEAATDTADDSVDTDDTAEPDTVEPDTVETDDGPTAADAPDADAPDTTEPGGEAAAADPPDAGEADRDGLAAGADRPQPPLPPGIPGRPSRRRARATTRSQVDA
ncbi:MAG: hypothetical protein ACK5PP_08035 [Acidimicrobiales bacterium]